MVKSNAGNVKMYLLIFTCLNIRAIHIEIVPDMSVNSFVLAMCRFTNMYGIPTHIYSDNAKTFIAGCDLLETVFASDEFKEHFQIYNIKHITIPLYSAWVGSTWERLIRTIKSCLYKTVGRAKIDYFDLLTVISDIKAAVNIRPLTYRCSSDKLEPITPNCFLHPNANSNIIIDQEDPALWNSEPLSRTDLVESLNVRQILFNNFREMWYENYLLSLRGQCRNLHETHFINKIKVDDVVLIKQPNKPRPFWLLGRVKQLVYGADDKIRSAHVKRGDGSLQLHSIKHLYPLELTLTHSHQPQVSEDHLESVSTGKKFAGDHSNFSGISDVSIQENHDSNQFIGDSLSQSSPTKENRRPRRRIKKPNDSQFYYY